ncbi:ATP-binding protein [Burkholderia sp. Ac-20365]|uniref:ATP-binding protein n=1 Tax=Burkholderia sp. Ac-20365 TaxID=2703897 RepID=UPI003216F778
MSVGLMILVHLIALVMVDRDRMDLDAQHLSRVVMATEKVRNLNPALSFDVAETLGVNYVAANDAAALAGCPARCQETHGPIEARLKAQLPAGSRVGLADGSTVWVQIDRSPFLIVIPEGIPSVQRFAKVLIVTFASVLVIAIFFAWHIQVPIRDLTRAARKYRRGRPSGKVHVRGPQEIRELIGDFNDMVSALSEADRQRAVMLAGIAHDLRSPVTRIQVRADLLADQKDRAGFLRDTESMSHIIKQFIAFAGKGTDRPEEVSVEQHCRQNYTDEPAGSDAQALVKLDLRAGPSFRLPAVDIDRIMSNLIENAMSYGEPPVEVSTSLYAGSFRLVVRDHGAGVPDTELENVIQPFVRLDAARGASSHSGLGLAIVNRLVRKNGGMFTVSNAADGGFVAIASFPDDR